MCTEVRKLAPLAVLLAAGLAGARGPLPPEDTLLIPDWRTPRVMAFSRIDGSLVNANFITAAQTRTTITVPKEAIRVLDEIWVSDQLENRIMRFSLDGRNFLGDFSNRPLSGIENVRGFEATCGKVYVACGAGTHAGKIAVLDLLSGLTITATATGPQPFDVQLARTELIVSDFTESRLVRLNYDGSRGDAMVALGTGFSPQQVVRVPGDRYLVTSYSSTPPGRIQELDASGAVVRTHTVPQTLLVAAHPLANGNIIFTTRLSVHLLNTVSGESTPIVTNVDAHYINSLAPKPFHPADWDRNGVVDFNDLLAFLNDFNAGDPEADLDGSGEVDFNDFLAFLNLFNTPC